MKTGGRSHSQVRCSLRVGPSSVPALQVPAATRWTLPKPGLPFGDTRSDFLALQPTDMLSDFMFKKARNRNPSKSPLEIRGRLHSSFTHTPASASCVPGQTQPRPHGPEQGSPPTQPLLSPGTGYSLEQISLERLQKGLTD